MYNHATALKALSLAVASTCMLACSYGTSRSSSDQFAANPNTSSSTSSQTNTIQRPDLNTDPVAINRDNYFTVSSLTLKTLLLTDSASGALNQSANLTQNRIGAQATGVVFNVMPFYCEEGGVVKISGQATSVGANQALNFLINTSFESCSQAGNRLTGAVSAEFDADITQMLNNEYYVFNASMDVDNLYIEDVDVPAVTLNGTYDFSVENLDSETTRTVVSTADTIFSNDTDFQMLDFNLVKMQNVLSGDYTYEINSVFSASYLEDGVVNYMTVEPLSGNGYAYPSAGKLAVLGIDSTVYITAMPNEEVMLELDENNDGSIDSMEFSTWADLVSNQAE